MHSFPILSLLFLASSVNAAAFNVLDRSEIPSLASTYWARYLNETNIQEDPPRGARLRRRHPRWFPSSVAGHIRPRQASTVNTTPSPSSIELINTRPTPEPTGDSSPSTTVHITDKSDFSLILPNKPGELIGDAEVDGVSYCSSSSKAPHCANNFSEGFVTAAAFEASDDGAYVQVTGCIDPTKFHLNPADAGGQFDVRYPNGAQCTFGGYGASFIELIEPATQRFCMRCCASANDQVNCNSHQDRAGCINAIPGVYDFPDLGVSCN
ncbi:hypothetical protein LshimejAT787_0202970 [Lyophyllum shimeji]|uniref:Uncharacterized protein n=1 Tax=Lyophyllum shimeji TaxID=47721 RepID=A0A9P3PEY6_LYOSH|nr:hypothetical protein LshimejAT787_0202970 [Lyophyllum shimeji]